MVTNCLMSSRMAMAAFRAGPGDGPGGGPGAHGDLFEGDGGAAEAGRGPPELSGEDPDVLRPADDQGGRGQPCQPDCGSAVTAPGPPQAGHFTISPVWRAVAVE